MKKYLFLAADFSQHIGDFNNETEAFNAAILLAKALDQEISLHAGTEEEEPLIAVVNPATTPSPLVSVNVKEKE